MYLQEVISDTEQNVSGLQVKPPLSLNTKGAMSFLSKQKRSCSGKTRL